MRGRWRIDRARLGELAQRRATLRAGVFDELRVGARFGPYHECIIRLERRPLAVTPGWFDPKEHPGHLAIHARNGAGVYLELALDAAARAQSHPFDIEILGRPETRMDGSLTESPGFAREPTLFEFAEVGAS